MLIPSLGDGSTNLAAVIEKKKNNASEEINSEWIFSLIPAVRQSLPSKTSHHKFLGTIAFPGHLSTDRNKSGKV